MEPVLAHCFPWIKPHLPWAMLAVHGNLSLDPSPLQPPLTFLNPFLPFTPFEKVIPAYSSLLFRIPRQTPLRSPPIVLPPTRFGFRKASSSPPAVTDMANAVSDSPQISPVTWKWTPDSSTDSRANMPPPRAISSSLLAGNFSA